MAKAFQTDWLAPQRGQDQETTASWQAPQIMLGRFLPLPRYQRLSLQPPLHARLKAVSALHLAQTNLLLSASKPVLSGYQ